MDHLNGLYVNMQLSGKSGRSAETFATSAVGNYGAGEMVTAHFNSQLSGPVNGFKVEDVPKEENNPESGQKTGK